MDATWDQRTILETHDPDDDDDDRYVPVATLEGVSLLIDSPTRLEIDGERWFVVRREVEIDTRKRTVVTTVTVVPDSGVRITIHPAVPEQAVSLVAFPFPGRGLAC